MSEKPLADRIDALAESLTERQDCNCAAIDIGVGIQHEPMCGSPNLSEVQEELNALAQEVRQQQARLAEFEREVLGLRAVLGDPKESSPSPSEIIWVYRDELKASEQRLAALKEVLREAPDPSVYQSDWMTLYGVWLSKRAAALKGDS